MTATATDQRPNSPAPPGSGRPPRRANWPGGARWLSLGERFGLLVLIVAIIVAWSVRFPDTFATVHNWQIIGSSQSVNLIIALALMVPLLSNNFDLSVGSTASLASMLTAGLMARNGWNLLEAVLMVLVIGLLIGAVNGLLVTRFGLNGLIATLGSATVLDGTQSWYSHNLSISSGFSQKLVDFGTATVWKIPWLTVVALLIALVTGYVVAQTPFGRRLVAVGSSSPAARLVGVRVDRLVLASYMTSGGLAAAGGVLLLAQQGSATPGTTGIGVLLPALAAVYLGASTWTPGQFNVVGTILGLVLVAVIVSGLTLGGAATWVSGVADGGALILAVGASAAFRRRRRGA
ncbi:MULTISPECIES: ABC transporter permease [unclassified Frankia]|uniref:ABC transporter permease n=1 Tax=unclassified Frankia TaxID=2632575 RepID=UPI002024185A